MCWSQHFFTGEEYPLNYQNLNIKTMAKTPVLLLPYTINNWDVYQAIAFRNVLLTRLHCIGLKWPTVFSDWSQMANGHLGWALNANVGHLNLGSEVYPGLEWPTNLKVWIWWSPDILQFNVWFSISSSIFKGVLTIVVEDYRFWQNSLKVRNLINNRLKHLPWF